MQLASAYEFNAEEDEARKYYTQLPGLPRTPSRARRPPARCRRLDLVGKSLGLKGTGAARTSRSTSPQLRGKSVLVVFWATWAEPVKRDLPELIKVYQKYHAEGFEIVGVSLDNDRADLDQFLKENPAPLAADLRAGGHGRAGSPPSSASSRCRR